MKVFAGFSLLVVAICCCSIASAYKTTPKAVRYPPPFVSYDEIAPAEIEVNEIEDISEEFRPRPNKKKFCVPNYRCITSTESKDNFSKELQRLRVNLDNSLSEQKQQRKTTTNPKETDEERVEKLLLDIKRFKGALEVLQDFFQVTRDKREFSCIFTQQCWTWALDNVVKLIEDATAINQLPKVSDANELEKRKIELKEWLRKARKVVRRVNSGINYWNANIAN